MRKGILETQMMGTLYITKCLYITYFVLQPIHRMWMVVVVVSRNIMIILWNRPDRPALPATQCYDACGDICYKKISLALTLLKPRYNTEEYMSCLPTWCIISLLNLLYSSTCFEHYCAHHQEDLIVYMHHLVPDIVTLLRRPFGTQVRRGVLS